LAKRVTAEKENNAALKVFISYAHKDEDYKNELISMLAGLERRGIIDIWQDREIEDGDAWLKEIEDAMHGCELALLFVSSNFINSRFIQGKEVPHLLQRRKEEGLRVVPIILDHCLWESEPVLSDLQAIPRDAKPIITFPKENGERTRAWKEIAQAIEKRAQK
jgi:TIR domain-containing protein